MATDPRPEPPGDDLAPAGELPAQLTSLVGRDAALAQLTGLLAGTRLLTLVGPGGCGKSRLALALAHRAAPPDGTWWADLAAAPGPDLVGHLVASATGGAQPRDASPAETVARRLRGRRVLVVLDNCEHVAGACAELACELLAGCPELTLLATSRQPLGAPGEQLWRVPGLPVGAPAGEAGPPGAVELFFDRARLVAPSLAPTEADSGAAERICRMLDGMPLAVELAAAKVSVLSVEQIAERLEHDIGFLRSSSPTAPPRHRSLEATLEWSHRMLAPGERALLQRLSVFAGGFSLDAVEAVCADDGQEAADVIHALARLVDHSLVQVEERGGRRRYRLPETVRQFAARALTAAGQTAELQQRHARYHLELAERLGGGDRAADELLEAEQDDLRAALRSQMTTAPELAGRLAGRLWPFWSRRGAYGEARLWLEQALEALGAMSPAVRAEVLTGAGVLAFLQCDYPAAEERLERALALYGELGDRRGTATALQRLGSIARERGRYADARALHERSRALWEELGDRHGIGISLDYLAFSAWLAGDFAAADELGRRALDALGDGAPAPETASALINLGAAAHYRGDLAGAEEHLERALALSRGAGYQEGIAWALHELGILARRRHHPARAAGPLRESLLTHQRLGDRWRIAGVLEEIAGSLLARLDPRAAAEVLGAAQAQRDVLGAPLPPAEREDRDRALDLVRARLSESGFAAAWARGAARGLDEAVELALGTVARLYGAEPAPGPAGSAPPLTVRERAVLELIGQGRTNREIADALFISPSTAGVHVSNILRKLGATSRAEASALAHRLELLERPAPSARGGQP